MSATNRFFAGKAQSSRSTETDVVAPVDSEDEKSIPGCEVSAEKNRVGIYSDVCERLLDEHDYYEEEVETASSPAFVRETDHRSDSPPSDDSFFPNVCGKSERNGQSIEISEGASRIINIAFERAVREAIGKGLLGRRRRHSDPTTVGQEELKQRLEQTAEELRPLMATGMVSRNAEHGLMHKSDLWSRLKTDKKLLANLFWEAKQQATTNQPASAYARYTLVAFYAATECLTYPQAAYRCSVSYTTAIEYIALCEVRHYFGREVAKEIHEFTKQQIDADDPNCMRAWSNNCAKFLLEHRLQREAKKNADLARPYDCRLYIHLKGDKRPFRIQKLQNCFLRHESTPTVGVSPCLRASPRKLAYPVANVAADETRPSAKHERPNAKKPRLDVACVEPVDLDSVCVDGNRNRSASVSLSGIHPPVPWTPRGDPFFLKSVTDMMKTPEDARKASDILYALSRYRKNFDGDSKSKMKTLARVIAAAERD